MCIISLQLPVAGTVALAFYVLEEVEECPVEKQDRRYGYHEYP